MQDSSQGIKVGDGIIEFVANMTQLDQGLDSIPGKVSAAAGQAKGSLQGLEQGLDSVGDAGSEAGDTIGQGMTTAKVNVREARGEVALLGEEFGIRLPRHVQTFVAQMPGVGEALQSAFAATAVIFLVEALIKGAEKLTEFISVTFIYTQAMKDMDAQIAASNKTHAEAVELLKQMKSAFDDSLLTPIQRTTKAHQELAEAVKKEEEEIKLLTRTAQDGAVAVEGYWDKAVNFALSAVDKVAGTNLAMERQLQQQIDANEKHQQDANTKLLELNDSLAKNKEKLREMDKTQEIAATKAIADAQFQTWQERQNIYEMEVAKIEKVEAENVKLEDSFKKLAGTESALGANPEDNPIVKAFNASREAAHQLGITLKSDLLEAYNQAATNLNLMTAAGTFSNKEMKDAKAAVDAADQALKNYDNTSTKTISNLLSMGLQLRKGKDDWQAFSTEVGQSVADAIVAGSSIGKAAEQAVEQELAALSKKALTQAIYYTGLGFAALAGQDYSGATQYFEAAGILGGIGVGAGIAAHSMGGGAGSESGSGSSSSGLHQAIQTTSATSQAPTNSMNVRSFEAGGLISAPTLAVVGDSGPSGEAVLPLDNDGAMARIAERIGQSGGGSGGNNFHIHVKGLVSPDSLGKVMRQISKKVKQGTGIMTASNTHRITRRSP
jgi:hypothetical protein